MGKLKRFTKEELEFIKEFYPIKGINYICSTLNRTKKSISNKASRLGLLLPIEIRSKDHYFDSDMVNLFYFDEEWSAEQAYIIGYIWADGNILDGCLQLECQSEDEKLIYLVTNSLQSKHKISRRSRVTKNGVRVFSTYVRIHGKALIDFLKKKTGLVENKTHQDIKFPKQLPCELFHHFIRGYFDGDGWLFNYPAKGKIATELGFTCTPLFAESIQSIICEYVGVPKNKIGANGNKQKKFTWGKLEDIIKICEWMYQDCGNLFLDRKKEIYDSHRIGRLPI